MLVNAMVDAEQPAFFPKRRVAVPNHPAPEEPSIIENKYSKFLLMLKKMQDISGMTERILKWTPEGVGKIEINRGKKWPGARGNGVIYR